MSYAPHFNRIVPFLSDECIKRQEAYRYFFGELHATGQWPQHSGMTRISDHGCGNGTNLATLACNLKTINDTPLSIHAVDHNVPAIVETADLLKITGIPYTANVGNALSPSNQELRRTLGLAANDRISISLAEHVLYAIIHDKQKLTTSLESVFSLLHPNAVFISVLSCGSDMDSVRKRYTRMSQDQRPPHEKLIEAVTAMELPVYNIPISATLADPGLSDDEWGLIASGLIHSGNAPNEKIATAITLFEFCVANYENLVAERALTPAIQDFRERLKRGFSIDSIIQIVPARNSSRDFLAAIERASKG